MVCGFADNTRGQRACKLLIEKLWGQDRYGLGTEPQLKAQYDIPVYPDPLTPPLLTIVTNELALLLKGSKGLGNTQIATGQWASYF